jgi:hypothetical protein
MGIFDWLFGVPKTTTPPEKKETIIKKPEAKKPSVKIAKKKKPSVKTAKEKAKEFYDITAKNRRKDDLKQNPDLKEINGIMHYEGNPYSGVFSRSVYENGIDITEKFQLLLLRNNAKHLHKIEKEGLEYQYNYYVENNLSTELNKISDDEFLEYSMEKMENLKNFAKELNKFSPEKLKGFLENNL